MTFVTGLALIDAPASALNNLGIVEGRHDLNTGGVKVIRTKDGALYPYVSAQAFRYWLRTTLEQTQSNWRSAPIYREDKVAYTDGDPILWWDDDLFGYMRAPGAARQTRSKDPEYAKLTPLDIKDGKEQAVTRAAPFRVSTFVSIAPVKIVEDWEVASRHEGDPVPYSTQFYQATLKGLFSLNLRACGTFWYRDKTGYRNLDKIRTEEAKKAGLSQVEGEKAFRLPVQERIERISTLFEGMALLEGGAKLTLHYTDVSPVLIMMAVTKGGNHPFGHAIGANSQGLPDLKIEALKEILSIYSRDILSDIYVGWVRGYLDGERRKIEALCETEPRIKLTHPKRAFQMLIGEIKRDENKIWLD